MAASCFSVCWCLVVKNTSVITANSLKASLCLISSSHKGMGAEPDLPGCIFHPWLTAHLSFLLVTWKAIKTLALIPAAGLRDSTSRSYSPRGRQSSSDPNKNEVKEVWDLTHTWTHSFEQKSELILQNQNQLLHSALKKNETVCAIMTLNVDLWCAEKNKWILDVWMYLSHFSMLTKHKLGLHWRPCLPVCSRLYAQ